MDKGRIGPGIVVISDPRTKLKLIYNNMLWLQALGGWSTKGRLIPNSIGLCKTRYLDSTSLRDQYIRSRLKVEAEAETLAHNHIAGWLRRMTIISKVTLRCWRGVINATRNLTSQDKFLKLYENRSILVDRMDRKGGKLREPNNNDEISSTTSGSLDYEYDEYQGTW